MSSALKAVPGVGKLDYVAGTPEFKVHYDAAKVDVKAIADACDKAGHAVTVLK